MNAPTETPAPTGRLKVRIVEGRVTWDCPLCGHKDFPPPSKRLAWVLDRARYHLRWAHNIGRVPTGPIPEEPDPRWTPCGDHDGRHILAARPAATTPREEGRTCATTRWSTPASGRTTTSGA